MSIPLKANFIKIPSFPFALDLSLVLGKVKGKRKRGYQSMRWLDSITRVMNMNLGKLWEMVRDREAWHSAVHEVVKSRTRLGY